VTALPAKVGITPQDFLAIHVAIIVLAVRITQTVIHVIQVIPLMQIIAMKIMMMILKIML